MDGNKISNQFKPSNPIRYSGKKACLAFISILILMTACNIQKRTYMPGYHVTWTQKQPKHDKVISGENKINITNNKKSEENQTEFLNKINCGYQSSKELLVLENSKLKQDLNRNKTEPIASVESNRALTTSEFHSALYYGINSKSFSKKDHSSKEKNKSNIWGDWVWISYILGGLLYLTAWVLLIAFLLGDVFPLWLLISAVIVILIGSFIYLDWFEWMLGTLQ